MDATGNGFQPPKPEPITTKEGRVPSFAIDVQTIKKFWKKFVEFSGETTITVTFKTTDKTEHISSDITALIEFENSDGDEIIAVSITCYKSVHYSMSLFVGGSSTFPLGCRYSVSATTPITVSYDEYFDKLLKGIATNNIAYRNKWTLNYPLFFISNTLISMAIPWILLSPFDKFPISIQILIAILGSVSTFFLLSYIRDTYNNFIERLSPIEAFLIGQQIKKYEKNMKLRENLFWKLVFPKVIAVVVGFPAFIYFLSHILANILK